MTDDEFRERMIAARREAEAMKGGEAVDALCAALITETCHSHDAEADHDRADRILVEVLRGAGLAKTADAWEAVDKWYA